MSSIGDEELRRRKLEEALEVKSLRRNISAYLKYTSLINYVFNFHYYFLIFVIAACL